MSVWLHRFGGSIEAMLPPHMPVPFSFLLSGALVLSYVIPITILACESTQNMHFVISRSSKGCIAAARSSHSTLYLECQWKRESKIRCFRVSFLFFPARSHALILLRPRSRFPARRTLSRPYRATLIACGCRFGKENTTMTQKLSCPAEQILNHR